MNQSTETQTVQQKKEVKKEKIGVLLVNLGTPDSPKTGDVRKYLREFLTDGRVIDIPWLPRQVLVNGVIAPFRSRSSAKLYKEIWDDKTGSPLMHYSLELMSKLRKVFQEEDTTNDYELFLAMRYQSPSIHDALEEMKMKHFDRIIVFPLFPQYASASTGSVHQKVMEEVGKWWDIPNMSIINSYFDNPKMIKVFADAGRNFGIENYDHVLFSFHGLPQSQLKKATKANKANHCLMVDKCCETLTEKNKFCYSAQCHATAQAIVAELGLSKDQYTICFQSRLGPDPWVQPYTSEVIEELAEKGVKKILCFCPAFVADCLETVFEISEEYQEEFEEKGGEHIQLVESLNAKDAWVDCVKEMILEA